MARHPVKNGDDLFSNGHPRGGPLPNALPRRLQRPRLQLLRQVPRQRRGGGVFERDHRRHGDAQDVFERGAQFQRG